MLGSRKFYAWPAIPVVIAAGLWFCWPWVAHQLAMRILETQVPDVGRVAPEFRLENSAGKRVQLSDFQGKVVLLNFWATWCGPCKTEIPWFAEFEREFAGKGFEVVGIAMDDDGWPVVKPFVAAQKVPYPVLLGDDGVSQLYGGVEALPTTFLIGRDGKVKYLHRGLIEKAEYAREIAELTVARAN